ncbi:MAG TPA: NTP transferase domain-containing protein [Candidatus Udaeobacter sp.]|nr:NTP transferase domain-containing protein [Candidatus Udaeobacter sp.]
MLPNKLSKTGVVILAAGEGKRMKSDLPKVMNLLKGKPLIEYVVANVEASGVCEKPVVIVNPNHTFVQDYLGDRAIYVIQDKQLGTGHAAACAAKVLQGKVENIIVLYGDMPFLKAESIKRLAEKHVSEQNILTLMTVTVPDFKGKYAALHDFGRIIRDENGKIAKSVELRDATPTEADGNELNPCYYCFNADWFWQEVKNLKNNNAQGEYYLTDLVDQAMKTDKVSNISIDPEEAIGINTKEHLEIAHSI